MSSLWNYPLLWKCIPVLCFAFYNVLISHSFLKLGSKIQWLISCRLSYVSCRCLVSCPATQLPQRESSTVFGALVPAGYHLISLIILAPEIVRPIKSPLIKTMVHWITESFKPSLWGKNASRTRLSCLKLTITAVGEVRMKSSQCKSEKRRSFSGLKRPWMSVQQWIMNACIVLWGACLHRRLLVLGCPVTPVCQRISLIDRSALFLPCVMADYCVTSLQDVFFH